LLITTVLIIGLLGGFVIGHIVGSDLFNLGFLSSSSEDLQTLTELKIDYVEWQFLYQTPTDTSGQAYVKVINVGDTSVTIESFSISQNMDGAPWSKGSILMVPELTLDAGFTETYYILFNELTLDIEHIMRLTTTTEFTVDYYTTPSKEEIDLTFSSEMLQYRAAYADWDNALSQWNVTVSLRNTGSADALVSDLLVNGKPYDEYESSAVVVTAPADFASNGLPLDSGADGVLEFAVDQSTAEGFDHGVSIEIRLYSASGQEYPKTITLD
jgi:hypothetical protein